MTPTSANVSAVSDAYAVRHPGYLLFILALSVLSLFTMGLVVFGNLTPEGRFVLEMTDLGICLAFFIDFVVTLSQSRRKLHYLATWGWLDLVSCIPVVGPLRAARAASNVWNCSRSILHGEVRSRRTYVAVFERCRRCRQSRTLLWRAVRGTL